MKISVIGPYPPFRGGISDFNYSLYREISKDNELQLINFTTQYPKILFPGKTQFKVEDSQDNKGNRVMSSINPLSWRNSANRIIEYNPDIIFVQYWMPFFAFAFNSIVKNIKKRCNAKIIAICHNLTPHEDWVFYKYITKGFLENIDKYVVMSDSVQSDLLYFIPNAEYKTLFHPIYDLFGEEIDIIEARKKLGITNQNIILYFGLIREYKGLDILLKSIQFLKNELDDFKVILAGECYENPQKYFDIIEELKLDKYLDINMEFIPDNDVKNYFSASNVVVLPYKTATQSGITNIAYNFNRPVIISDVGGLSETVLNGKTGYVTKPLPKDIANSVIKYFTENKYQEFSGNIKDYKKQYSWSIFANKLMEFAEK